MRAAATATSSPPWARQSWRLCVPSGRKPTRLMKDKGYLESVYKAGAEKAGYVAEKTLRKVYKKVGFVAR